MAMPPDRQQRQVLSVRAKRLAKTLRQYREAAKLNQSDVAARMEWSTAKVGHIETGRRFADVGDVELLLDIYGVTDPQREAMLKLAREARRRNWWNEYEDVYNNGYLALEDEATGIDDWCPLVVPGLVQTRDYARALIAEGWGAGDADSDGIERRLQARMLRQAILLRPDPPRLRIVLDPAVLARPVGGPKVMREQLLRLAAESQREFVTIQVLPGDVGAHPGLSGPLIILHFETDEDPESLQAEAFPGDPDVAYVEGFQGSNYLEGAKKVRDCNLAMERIRELALSPQESVELIEATARSM